jgi:KUP system potassium uptake protein
MSKPSGTSESKRNKSQLAGNASLILGATGVVFGDIGTSPIYALKETLHKSGAAVDDIYGVISLFFWTLTLIVSLKYLSFVMRADNKGEGGILALLSLMPRKIRGPKTVKHNAALILILVGTALLFGDGVLTPAISVLSATEGLSLLNKDLEHVAVPLTVVILAVLFLVQSRGTHAIGTIFGPVMLWWFGLIGGLGFYRFLAEPAVIKALSPVYAIEYIGHNGFKTFAILASVILCVTGAEALYADMGHFGVNPIRWAWMFLVGPALVMCYLGQAALVSTNPEAASNPFFGLAPNQTVLVVLIVSATLATVIASQALITGVFSLSRQAVQLGLFPRLTIRHTSAEHEGQIYVPIVNWLVGITSIVLVIGFKSSSALASAYVLAIAGTMAITTFAFHIVARQVWEWPIARVLPLTLMFLVVDLSFLIGTAGNIFDGGWVPIVLGGAVFALMSVWRTGNRALNRRMRESTRTWQDIYQGLETGEIASVPGVAIFMASPAEMVPAALISHVTVMHSLPEEVVIVTVMSDTQPISTTPVLCDHISDRLCRVTIYAGYMEGINLPEVLEREILGEKEKVATYYLSERHFLATNRGSLGHRTEALFELLHRNSVAPTEFYGLPYDRVITIGTRIDL